MATPPETSPQAVPRARQWGEYILSILAGNILYMLIEPELPTFLHHRLFRADPGVLFDFLLCALIYGLVRLAHRI